MMAIKLLLAMYSKTELADVVAVTGNPVEPRHVPGQHVVGAVETDVDLRSADGQKGSRCSTYCAETFRYILCVT